MLYLFSRVKKKNISVHKTMVVQIQNLKFKCLIVTYTIIHM